MHCKSKKKFTALSPSEPCAVPIHVSSQGKVFISHFHFHSKLLDIARCSVQASFGPRQKTLSVTLRAGSPHSS